MHADVLLVKGPLEFRLDGWRPRLQALQCQASGHALVSVWTRGASNLKGTDDVWLRADRVSILGARSRRSWEDRVRHTSAPSLELDFLPLLFLLR